MEERVLDERDIDIGMLLIKIAKAWKYMLVIGIVFSICFSLLKYVKDYAQYQDDVEEVTTATLIDKLTLDEYENVSAYISLFEKLSELQEQSRERVQYQLDPYNKNVLSISCIVDLINIDESNYSDGSIIAKHMLDENHINQLSAIYRDYMVSQELIQDIMIEMSGVSENDVRSLINCKYYDGVITFQLAYTESMNVDRIVEIVKDDLIKYCESNQNIVAHELIINKENYNNVIDNDLAKLQNDFTSQIYSFQYQINVLEAGFNENEKQYIKAYLSEKKKSGQDVENIQVESIVKTAPCVSKKMIVVGFVIGVILVCVWTMLKYIFTGKLRSSDDLIEYYQLQLFGIQTNKYNGGMPKGIDKLIYNIECRNRKKLDIEEQKKVIISSISLRCQQSNIQEVIITGTDIENIDIGYLDEIKSGLTENGITVTIEDNIYYYPEALQNAAKVKNIIIIETVDSSIEKEIENILLKAKEYSINVMGAVVFDS